MLLTHLILQIAALATAWAYARHRPAHAPLFWLLFAWTASTWACILIASASPDIIRADDPALSPLVGLDRTIFVLYTAGQLVWPIGLAALASHLSGSPRAVTGALEIWIGCVLFLLFMPDLRGEDLRLFLLAVRLSSLFAVACCVMGHYHYRLPVGPAHHCLLLCSLVELGVLVAGPWRLGLWGRWPLALFGYSVLSALLTCYQGGLLWIRRSSRP